MNTESKLSTLKHNPLPNLARVLKRISESTDGCIEVYPGGWIKFIDASVTVGFHMKLSGLDWRTNDELALIMANLADLKFLEMSKTPEGKYLCRVNPLFVSDDEVVARDALDSHTDSTLFCVDPTHGG